MTETQNLTENQIRTIVRDEIDNYYGSEPEYIKESELTQEDKQDILKANQELKEGKTKSFEQVYEELIKN
ncbi:MAG: hypothetical protein HRU03_03705 [Nanoarchaeales archaeon]|nr:hypothetical protein [Nanoarchaeales archaeon]